MSDQVFDAYYREIYTDLAVTQDESDEIQQKFLEANPPPDKLVKLRASAFRIACEFLSEDTDSNVSLLKSINALVHSLETTCMCPNVEEENEDFDQEAVEELYRQVFSDLSIDSEENDTLKSFLEENKPPLDQLLWTRSSAFRIGSEFLSDDSTSNTSLFRCINAIVHAIEMTCMKPKPYKLALEPDEESSVDALGVEESISIAAQILWDLDVNRLTPGDDYVVNVQAGKKPYQTEDLADDPLFTEVKDRVFRRPTYSTFMALLDNYVSETGVTEEVTSTEEEENYAFLNAIMQTAPMQYCHKYCCANKEDIPSDPDEFIQLLYGIWFGLYKRCRGGRPDSSGFEHVFVGEIKNDKVSGFHNWVYFYLEELKGNVNYKGYIKPRGRENAETNEDDHVLTLQFEWYGVEKFVGTSFIGVSPEFEMALYTMCFIVGEEENILDIDMGTDVFKLNCKVYTYAEDKIGTSFVEALEHYD